MTTLECNSVEIIDIYIVETSPPNQHAIPTLWFVYLANNFNNLLKCHLFVLHILTYIECRIVNDMYNITR